MRLILRSLLLLKFLLVGGAVGAEESQKLFNGKNLDGWRQLGGDAEYRAEDGAIVGVSVPNSPNSFLCTSRLYGDFVLELEFKCDSKLNSGVQVRSNAYAAPVIVGTIAESIRIPAGRVHGYQVEIDADKPHRLWVAGVYDESRRGWLYPGPAGGSSAEFTEGGQQVYRANGWNELRIECKGNRIRTWLNGEPRADFKDSLTSQGFIALQVHSVPTADAVGKEARWRNLRLTEIASDRN